MVYFLTYLQFFRILKVPLDKCLKAGDWWKFGFFLYIVQAKMLGCDVMMYAVWKSTRDK